MTFWDALSLAWLWFAILVICLFLLAGMVLGATATVLGTIALWNQLRLWLLRRRA